MKIKQSILLILLCFFCISSNANTALTLKVDNLPPKAQLFLQNYFPDTNFKTIEKYKRNKIYQLETNNGWKFTFSKDGSWIDIDCNQDCVPSTLVPSSILNQVAKYYGTAVKVVKITTTRKGNYYIKLSNCIKIAFDKQCNKIDYK